MTRGSALAALVVCLVVSGCGGGGTTDGGTPPATTYTISGTVSGAAAAGVTVALSGSSTASTTTDPAGVFSFAGLANGSYTVTPTRVGFTFTPSSSSVTVSGANVAGRNFTATAVASTYSIAGTVSGAVAAGVTITLSGTSSATTTTSGTGTYTFTGLVNGSYTVTPSLTGYTFSPTSSPVTVNGASAAGKDFTATAIPTTGPVSGRLYAEFREPLQGAFVSANGGAAVAVASDGTFTIPNVTVPYQLVAYSSSRREVVIVNGATARAGVSILLGYDDSMPAFTSSALIAGTVTGIPAGTVEYDWVVTGSLLNGAYFNLRPVVGPGGQYGPTSLGWMGSQALSETLYLLARQTNTSGDVIAFSRAARSITLNPGQSLASQDFALSSLSSGTIGGSLTLPATFCGLTGCTAKLVSVDAINSDGDRLHLGYKRVLAGTPASFQLLAPNDAGPGFLLTVEAAVDGPVGANNSPARARLGQIGVAVGANVSLVVRDPPVLTAPADGATGIGPGSMFSWTDSATDATFEMLAWCGTAPNDVEVRIIGTAASTVLPDLAPLGVAWPSGANCSWGVTSHAPDGIDAVITETHPSGTWQSTSPGIGKFTSR